MVLSQEQQTPVRTRVAIYVRVSTEEQAEYGFSIDAQLHQLRSYCDLYEKTIFKEYVERGVSGKNITNRYELQKMLRDAENGLFDEVLVLRFNRLARSTIDLLRIVEHLRKHNIAFRSFAESFETETPMGRFALSMMGAVGELERDTILANSKMGSQQRANTGGHIAKPPIGYKVVILSMNGRKRETRIDVVPDEAVIVRRIFEQYASGSGLRSIANKLNHDGHLTKRGNPFSTCAIKDIIENPFYVGKIRYCRYLNWSENRRKGKNPSPTVTEGIHPPIISEVLWDKVQFLRNKKGHATTKRFHGECLLTGLLRCPQCGSAMTANPTKNKLKDGSTIVRMYYVCGNFRSKGSAVCKSNGIRQLVAEDYVLNRIKEVLSKPHILRPIVKSINDRKVNRIKPLQDELSAVHARLADINIKKMKYLELYEIDQFEKKLFAERLAELESELDLLHARRSELEFELDGDHSQSVTYEAVRSLITRFDHLLSQSSFDQRKTLLHLIINKITVGENKQINKIEMIFDEMTEHHFLRVAPSADNMAEGAFPFSGEAPQHKHKLLVVI
jgi:site-specific DNA recombinase